MIQARHIRVSGLVQGVGFRPFVWRLAKELELAGWVRNDAAGVEIAVEGEADQLDALLRRLEGEAPAPARIDRVQAETVPAVGSCDFVIAESGSGKMSTAIGHDTGLCGDCLSELFDPSG
ncbi:MAG TPA: acylphosphatase, partial [Rhodocyclaceae bacterium]|nr:acylphosphatase [Rhodocyclaceae bacterium]